MIVVFEVSGQGSCISQIHHPAIELDPNKQYGIGLLSFSAFNSIPNVYKGCNKIYYGGGGGQVFELPTGSYELKAIDLYVQRHIKEGKLRLRANTNTLQTEINSKHEVDFTKSDSLAKLLGFESVVLPPGFSKSTNLVTIFNVNMINIECNIAMGSYKNGIPDRSIHQFVPRVPPGYKIISSPANPTFFPINTRFIDTVEFTLTDQNGDLVNFRNELVSIRVMIKEISNENYLPKKSINI